MPRLRTTRASILGEISWRINSPSFSIHQRRCTQLNLFSSVIQLPLPLQNIFRDSSNDDTRNFMCYQLIVWHAYQNNQEQLCYDSHFSQEKLYYTTISDCGAILQINDMIPQLVSLNSSRHIENAPWKNLLCSRLQVLRPYHLDRGGYSQYTLFVKLPLNFGL